MVFCGTGVLQFKNKNKNKKQKKKKQVALKPSDG